MILWSAHFLDGTELNQLKDPKLPFGLVNNRINELHHFMLHYSHSLKVAVRLTDGLFYHGPDPLSTAGWFPGPTHQPQSRYRLYFSRSCQGKLNSGKLTTTITDYNLGWTSPSLSQIMLLDPNGSFTWRKTI